MDKSWRIFGREVEQFANVEERKRPATIVGDDPNIGIEVEFAFDGSLRHGSVADPAGPGQDAGGQFAFCFRDSVFFGGVHVFDLLVSFLFKKSRTPHFREFQIFFGPLITGAETHRTGAVAWSPPNRGTT